MQAVLSDAKQILTQLQCIVHMHMHSGQYCVATAAAAAAASCNALSIRIHITSLNSHRTLILAGLVKGCGALSLQGCKFLMHGLPPFAFSLQPCTQHI